jgi:acetyl esterase/lipase
MRLWPEEYEELRDEARSMAETITEMVRSAKTTVPTTREEKVQGMRELTSATETPSPDGVDRRIAGIGCRVFPAVGSARGLYLQFHGSGMIAGSPVMDDLANAALASRLGIAVVSVDYRLAPEHPYPAAIDDSVAVAQWLLEHAETEFGTARLVIGGESAGAYLAVMTLLRLREEHIALDPFRGANLAFGVYDLSGTPSARGAGPTDVPDILDDEVHELIHDCYLGERTYEESRAPEISPLYADLQGMPPALFTVGSADRLLDDSLFMAARWAAFENDVELAVYPDCMHSFVRLPIALAERAHERIDAFFEQVLS